MMVLGIIEDWEEPGVSYPGGKAGAGVYQTIINQQPPHDLYVEPFVGGGAILRAKRPALRSIALDLAGDVVARLADLAGVEAVQGCGLEWLARHRYSGRELVYADPPYLRSARRSGRDLYQFEWTDADHQKFLGIVTALPCMVQVSGYWSDLYAEALAGWRCIRFQAMTRAGRPAEECLWMNYPEPVALHDYRYLGRDYRERERIKRKAVRWRDGLGRLPDLERQAILSALLEG